MTAFPLPAHSTIASDAHYALPAKNGSVRLPQNFIVFSHLRWDFVYQRPQHLVTRLAASAPVFFIEEPVFDAAEAAFAFHSKGENVTVAVPHLPAGLPAGQVTALLRMLLEGLLATQHINLNQTAFWYYTPMALPFSRQLEPLITVYDCMDELSAFKFAPEEITSLENELLRRADVVFTGGISLYEAKKHLHPNIHPFPSSIDRAHFGQAKTTAVEPEDQRALPHPRLGFFGVIDERFDTSLIRHLAEARPDWHLVVLGPVVKIDPVTLPQGPNIHYLGSKQYNELPAYLSGWDVAMIPFAINESTRFISPTKTPEYLAAGIPVVSTPIRDIVTTYGAAGLAQIAADGPGFVQAAERLLQDGKSGDWVQQVDAFLAVNSWDETFEQMRRLLLRAVQKSRPVQVNAEAANAS